MFDEQQRIIAANHRFAAIYGMSHDQVKPGTTLEEFIRLRRDTGIPPAELRDAPMGGPPETDKDGVETSVYDLTNGRTIARSRRPLPSGGWVSTHEDITELRRIEKQLAYMAEHDALTDLPNRSLLSRRIEAVLPQAKRGKGFAILFVDLDRFKNVNDALGHAAGDQLLQQVAQKLRRSVREQDTVARLGGDEFAILQVSENQPRDSTALAKRINEVLKGTFDIDGHKVTVDTSIGIALAPADGFDAATLLRCADMALYRAKAEGRGTWRFFEAQMDLRMQARRRTEVELRQALENGHLSLYYQPLIRLSDERLGGFEALLRWHHPERGVTLPGDFMDVAEESGLIIQIGDWVLKNAAMQAMAWPEELRVSVNLSPVQFRASDVIRSVSDALDISGLAPERLELEITEAVLLRNTESTLEVLRSLRELGVGIVMDDFGSGYSSLGYLREFPFDRIKIDRSFVMDMPQTERAGAIVRAVASLGSALGMSTTAEGIETSDQLDIVRNAGYSLGQGFIFSPPRPAAEVSRMYFDQSDPPTVPMGPVRRASEQVSDDVVTSLETPLHRERTRG